MQEEKNLNQRQTCHKDVKNRTPGRQQMNVSDRRHCYRNSLVVSEPADGTGDIMINTGENNLEDDE